MRTRLIRQRPPATSQLRLRCRARGRWALSSWKDPDLGPSTSIQLLDEPGTPEDQER
ncbi:MAG: hypothetical protein NTU53_17930 [Planctomycetota bacterium]|nr:hypothetical protein [Planctomycetota bacterium]